MGRIRGFLGLAQLAEPLHVLANLNRLPFDIRDRPHAFFGGQALPIGACDRFR